MSERHDDSLQDSRDSRDLRRLLVSVAFVWLSTALLIAHPSYRQVGEEHPDTLGLPHALMWATCAFELALGLRVALGRPTVTLALLQGALVLGFTVILAWQDLMLLAHTAC